MTISASFIASSNPNVLQASGSQLNLNALLLSQATDTPLNSIASFATANDVGNYYGFTSPEYNFAAIYFAGPNNAKGLPAALLVAQYNAAAAAAWTRGASLGSMTLAQLQALTGTLTVNVDGTPTTSSTINLTAATSFSNAATLIQAAFTSPGFTVAYNSQHNAYVFTGTATGANHNISVAQGTLADSLGLDAAQGAVVSPGAAAATPSTFMPIVANLSQQWASFATTWEPLTADKLAFSAWVALQHSRYGYVGYDSDPKAAVSGNTTTWYAQVQAAGYGSSLPVYGNLTHAALVCSWAASLNFDQPNGRTDLAGISFSGVTPYVTDNATYSALTTNGYNFYGAFATATSQWNLFQDGGISGVFKWADTFFNQIKFNADLQNDAMNLLSQAGSIPYNPQGYSTIEAAFLDSINAALSFGTIRTGVQLSSQQKQDVFNAVGVDVSAILQTQGWYLQVVPGTPAQRAARTSPAITLYYTDGGDVQTIAINTVEIQ